jgi:hypothetical protein
VIRRAARLEAIAAAKRELHPELARPLTWAHLRAVCAREGVHLEVAAMPPEQPAQLVPFFNRWTILVSKDVVPRERVRLAAHEIGHLWAHHDPQHDRWELVYQIAPPAPDGGQEREAEGIAFLLVEGLAAFPPRPRRAPAVAVAAAQQLQDPYSLAPTAVTFTRREPRYGGAKHPESRLQQAIRLAKRASWRGSPYRTAIG